MSPEGAGGRSLEVVIKSEQIEQFRGKGRESRMEAQIQWVEV